MADKFNRRDFLKLAGLGALGGIGAVTGLDKFVLDGTLTDSILIAARDEEYRHKLLEIITSGRAPQKIKQEYFEKIIPYIKERSLGERVNLTESILDSGFKNYEIRKLVEGDSETNKLVLVGSLNTNGSILKTKFTNNNERNLTKTLEVNGPHLTLPSANMIINNPRRPFFYSAYDYEGGIVRFSENTMSVCSGAIILQDGSINVIDKPNISNYSVADNCDAIQGYPIAVNSTTLEQDLESISNARVLSMNNPLTARNFDCFVATFTDSFGLTSTKIVSSYMHLDDLTHKVTGEKWYITMSVEHIVGICNKLKNEGGYSEYTFVVPDPNYIHSRINGPIVDSQDMLLRTFSGSEATFDESKYPFGYIPPFTIALSL